MARGISLSVRRGLLLLSALVFFVVRAQTQIAVSGCAGCTVACVAGPRGVSTLQVACDTPLAFCAMCITRSSSAAVGQATNSIGDTLGCTAQVGLAAAILGECSTATTFPLTSTPSGTRAITPTVANVSPGNVASPTSTSQGSDGLPQNGGAGNSNNTSSSDTSGGLAPGAIAGIAIGAVAVLGAIIAAAFILRSRKRKSLRDPEPDLVEDSHPELVENQVVSIQPPKAEKSPAASIEAKPTEAFNPYPGPNDNPQ